MDTAFDRLLTLARALEQPLTKAAAAVIEDAVK
jgi:hypothetical protein